MKIVNVRKTLEGWKAFLERQDGKRAWVWRAADGGWFWSPDNAPLDDNRLAGSLDLRIFEEMKTEEYQKQEARWG